jgi:hypothetical protein
MMVSKGQAFLGLIFLIGTIILVIGVTLAILETSLIDTAYGYRSSLQAEAVATSGAQDALLQLDRGAFTSNTNYTLPVASSTATIAVTLNSPSSGFDTILSTAIVSNRTRKVNVVVTVNATTTQATVVSWQEIQ